MTENKAGQKQATTEKAEKGRKAGAAEGAGLTEEALAKVTVPVPVLAYASSRGRCSSFWRSAAAMATTRMMEAATRMERVAMDMRSAIAIARRCRRLCQR